MCMADFLLTSAGIQPGDLKSSDVRTPGGIKKETLSNPGKSLFNIYLHYQ